MTSAIPPLQLPLSQGRHDKTQPLLTHRTITPFASPARSAGHDEHSPDKFSRSIGRCTISIQQINAQRGHVVHRYVKVRTHTELTSLRSVFTFILSRDTLPSSRWYIHTANATLEAESWITVVLHEKLFHNKTYVKSFQKEYWAEECL